MVLMKKAISVLLSVLLMLTILTTGIISAEAAEGDVSEANIEPTTELTHSLSNEEYDYSDSDYNGKCGENAYWDFYNDGRLIIHGQGKVTSSGWDRHRNNIKYLQVLGVENLPEYSFYGFQNLESVFLDDTITSLGVYKPEYYVYDEINHENVRVDEKYPNTFANCKNLKNIKLSNNLTRLDGYEFSGCTSLETITIPENLISIGKSSFDGCINLTRVDISDIDSWCKIQFSQYSSNPLTYAHNLYLNNELIVNLELPNDVTSIGDFTFCGCSCLTSITIPYNLSSIGFNAFYGCDNLKRVDVPSTEKWLELSFTYDYHYTVYTPITDWLFPYKTRVKTEYYANPLCCGADLYVNGTLLTDLIIDNATTIPAYQFYKYNSLKTVIINGGVSSIGECAFAYCTNLQEIKIGEELKEIGARAFLECSNLKTVDIPYPEKWLELNFRYTYYKTVEPDTMYGEPYLKAFTDYSANPLYCGADLYVNGVSLTDLVINNTDIKKIQPYQFYKCKNLKTLTINSDVSTLGDNAFFNCSNLQKVKLNKCVDNIGEKAFWNCAKLKDIYFYNPECSIYEAYETISGSALIHGYASSTAEMYAGNYNRNFVLINDEPDIIGDLNGDNSIDVLDATVVQKYASGKVDLTDEQITAADVNNDGVADILDAADIQKHAVGKITDFKKK